jgi:hypothetical protein
VIDHVLKELQRFVCVAAFYHVNDMINNMVPYVNKNDVVFIEVLTHFINVPTPTFLQKDAAPCIE